MIQKLSLSTIFFFLPVFVFAEVMVSDYQYQKNIAGSGSAGLVSFPVDAEMYEYADQFFSDLRIVNQDNEEVPFVVQQKRDSFQSQEFDHTLSVVAQTENTFVLDMGAKPQYRQKISLRTDSVDFSRVVDVYGSHLADSRFERLTDEQKGDLIAIVPGNDDTTIDFKYNNYRYIKLVFSGTEGDFTPKNFFIKKVQQEKKEGEKETFVLEKEEIASDNPREQKILFTVSGVNTPIHSFILHSEEKDFLRQVIVYAANDKNAQILENNKRYDANAVYWKKIYQGDFQEQVYSNEQIFSVADNKKYYLVVIDNADNAQLKITGATATRYIDTVYAEDMDFSNHTYRLLYGNVFAKKPKYDTQSLTKKVNKDEMVKNSVQIGDHLQNPLYLPRAEKIGEEKPYLIYIFIGMLVVILFWFVYKIMKETRSKDGGEEVDIIEKL